MGKDVCVEITFPVKGKEDVRSNIDPKYISDFLTEWCLCQIGKGRDKRIPNKFDIYHVKIMCDLKTDTFSIESDTGNDALTLGIVMCIVARMESEKHKEDNL